MAARILIIEDNQPNMDLISYLLTAFGHHPLAAYDGEQGVQLARSALPDLIVCDLHLPRLDGYGVVRALKADPATRAIPVLAASAMPVTDGGAALRVAGFDGHLPKSLEPDTLIPSLETYLPPHLRSAQQPDEYDSGVPAVPAAGAGAAATPLRILLIDAAPANYGLTASLLSHFGYPLASVSDAGEAADCAGQHFDLIVCDLDGSAPGAVPFADGVLHAWPALPLVLLRAAADENIEPLLSPRVPASPGAPAAHYVLTHPIEPLELAAAIAQCLEMQDAPV